MIDILRPIIEIAVILPGILLAYLPMSRHLRISKGKLLLLWITILIFICTAGGTLCYFVRIKTIWIIIPVFFIAAVIYCRTLKIVRWKSISVILAVYGVFSCIRSISEAIDFIIYPDNRAPWFCLNAALIYNVFCWIVVILTWHPATHAARDLLEYEGIAQTWYVFWILPIMFISLNLFLTPIHPEIVKQGRTLQLYLINNIALLCLLFLFYLLFYLMANNLNRNDRLRQENQFLSMQQAQYDNLCTAIAETREARHDMRHHFSTLTVLANRKEWKQLKDYLALVQEGIPDSELNLCENSAVDGVAGHYCLRYKENSIPFSIKLDLPYELPISEMDMCLVMSNLLENALEASLRTNDAKRYIKIEAYIHSNNVVLLTVENAFDGTAIKKNDIFQSSKRRGNGVGIQSVRRIAEKNGGYCCFTAESGVFCANVMLRGENSNSH